MKTTNRIIKTLLGPVLSLLALFGPPNTATAQTPDARIVFNSNATTSGPRKNPIFTSPQIYSMNPDGTDVVKLTDYEGGATWPSWSPDQVYISFICGGGLQIMEAIGQANGGRTLVAATDVQNTGLDWSPDGTRICYSGSSTRGLWIVTVNPEAEEVGTPIQVATGWCGYPSWSPDGRTIAFTFLPDGLPWGNQFVKFLDLETGAETSFDMVSSAHPEWNPDGSMIAFDATVRVTTTKGNKTTTNSYAEVLERYAKPEWGMVVPFPW
jgi:TolB protein